MPDDAHDGLLLARVGRGDPAAFDELYARCSPLVYGMVLQVLRDPAQAEEVAQEVFVEAWRNAARFDPGRGTARSWLLTMSRRRAIDRVRSAQAAADRDVRAGVAAVVPDYDQVAEAVWQRFEHEQVRRCLDALTRLQHEAVALAFYRGQTQREVSQTLGVPLGTVKTRLRDGLIRMRDCLGVDG